MSFKELFFYNCLLKSFISNCLILETVPRGVEWIAESSSFKSSAQISLLAETNTFFDEFFHECPVFCIILSKSKVNQWKLLMDCRQHFFSYNF